MTLMFRISNALLQSIHTDLSRPHAFAAERVGFLACGVASTANNGLGIYGASYHPVLDEDYLDDRRAAAMLGPAAFRKILQQAYREPAAVFHIHRHDHYGAPSPSRIDETESEKFIPDFWKVCPRHPHGILILSMDSLYGRVWHPASKDILPFTNYKVVSDGESLFPRRLHERA
jgi:hypothetical protein